MHCWFSCLHVWFHDKVVSWWWWWWWNDSVPSSSIAGYDGYGGITPLCEIVRWLWWSWCLHIRIMLEGWHHNGRVRWWWCKIVRWWDGAKGKVLSLGILSCGSRWKLGNLNLAKVSQKAPCSFPPPAALIKQFQSRTMMRMKMRMVAMIVMIEVEVLQIMFAVHFFHKIEI